MNDDVRLGALVIHNDPVPEQELWEARPPRTTIHTARFDTPRRTGEEFTGRSVDRLLGDAGLRRSIEQLADLGTHAIGYCFASASVFGGGGFDEEFEHAATEAAGGVPVVTAGRALKDAVHQHPGRKFLVIAPPWFSDATLEALSEYLRIPDRLMQVTRYKLDSSWDKYSRPDLFDAGARYAIDPGRLLEQVAAFDPGAIDALVIPGGGLRSLAAQAQLRDELGLETLSANGALLRSLSAIGRSRRSDLPDPVG